MSRSWECSILHNNTVIVHVGTGGAQADGPFCISLFLFEISLVPYTSGDIESASRARVTIKRDNKIDNY